VEHATRISDLERLRVTASGFRRIGSVDASFLDHSKCPSVEIFAEPRIGIRDGSARRSQVAGTVMRRDSVLAETPKFRHAYRQHGAGKHTFYLRSTRPPVEIFRLHDLRHEVVFRMVVRGHPARSVDAPEWRWSCASRTATFARSARVLSLVIDLSGRGAGQPPAAAAELEGPGGSCIARTSASLLPFLDLLDLSRRVQDPSRHRRGEALTNKCSSGRLSRCLGLP